MSLQERANNEPLSMNKLLIVGHPDSGINELGSLLHRHGFRPALPQLREGASPDEVLAGMRRSRNLPETGEAVAEEDFQQIHPGLAWQGPATDVLMGNRNQDPWFLASPDILPFLTFWMDLDPGFLVVMLYDDPHGALGEERKSGPASLDDRIGNWKAYHSAMLQFHRSNRERTLLVHSRQALADGDSLVSLIAERISVKVRPPGFSGGEESPVDGQGALGSIRATEIASRFLQAAIIARDPRIGTIYQELQAAASLPMREVPDVPSPEEALEDLVAHWTSLQLHADEEKGRDAVQMFRERYLAEIQEALEKNYLETQGYKWRLGEAERLLERPYGAAELVKQQFAYRLGSTLVNQSKSVLGLLFLPIVLLVEIIHFLVTRIGRKKQKLPPLRGYADYEAAERVKRQLSYRIGRTLLQNLKSPAGWFRLPSALSGEIREFKKSRRAESAEGKSA